MCILSHGYSFCSYFADWAKITIIPDTFFCKIVLLLCMKPTFPLCIILALTLLSCAGHESEGIELNSEADLAGLRVAACNGSCYEMDLSVRDDVELLRYNNDSDALQALLNGKVDAFVNDETVFNSYVRAEYGIRIALLSDRAFPTAFMFNKEDSLLRDACNATQRRLVSEGSLTRMIDYWLNDKYIKVEKHTHIPTETSGKPIRVATATATAPISFPVGDDWFGLELDILREMAKELHRPLEVKLYDVTSAFMAIKTGKADIMAGGIFVTPERQEEFLFSDPYYSFRGAYFVLDKKAEQENLGLRAALKRSIYKNLIVEDRWKYITQGLWETLKISLLAILLGSLLGILIYIMSRSRRKWVRSAAQLYNGFMSGIPDLVLLLILFYVVFAKSGTPPDLVAIITFALFFASGASDIYGTSLNAIPHGQTEAGLALGFTKSQTFFNIVLPQALKRGLPLYKGQCIATLKGTAIVGYIAIQDLTRAGDIIRSRTFDALVPLAVVTIIYFLLVWLIGLLLRLAMPKKNVL